MSSRFGDLPVGFEELANVHRLAAPEVSMDGPVEGEFERPSVEGAVSWSGCRMLPSSIGGAYSICGLEAMATQYGARPEVRLRLR